MSYRKKKATLSGTNVGKLGAQIKLIINPDRQRWDWDRGALSARRGNEVEPGWFHQRRDLPGTACNPVATRFESVHKRARGCRAMKLDERLRQGMS